MAQKNSVKEVETHWGIIKVVATKWGARPLGLRGFYPEQGRFEGHYNRIGDFICGAPFFQLREVKQPMRQEIINSFTDAAVPTRRYY